MIKIKSKHSNSEKYLNTSNINIFSVQMEERILFQMSNGEMIIGENSYNSLELFNKKTLDKFIKTIAKETQLDTYINKNNICYINPVRDGCQIHMLNGDEFSVENDIDIFLKHF